MELIPPNTLRCMQIMMNLKIYPMMNNLLMKLSIHMENPNSKIFLKVTILKWIYRVILLYSKISKTSKLYLSNSILREILKEFHKLDRDRTYFPIFILKDKNQEFIGNAKMKKNKKRIQRELEKSYKCVKPEDITQRAH